MERPRQRNLQLHPGRLETGRTTALHPVARRAAMVNHKCPLHLARQLPRFRCRLIIVPPDPLFSLLQRGRAISRQVDSMALPETSLLRYADQIRPTARPLLCDLPATRHEMWLRRLALAVGMDAVRPPADTRVAVRVSIETKHPHSGTTTIAPARRIHGRSGSIHLPNT